MSTLNSEQKVIADELDKIQIDQLHKATLSFSKNSQENKKLCVTVWTAVYTVFVGIYSGESLADFAVAAASVGVLISVLFYLVDVVLYYYQDKLRENMQKSIDDIKQRHGISVPTRQIRSHRLRRSFINGSQIIYLGLAAISLVAPVLIKKCIEWWGRVSA